MLSLEAFSRAQMRLAASALPRIPYPLLPLRLLSILLLLHAFNSLFSTTTWVSRSKKGNEFGFKSAKR